MGRSRAGCCVALSGGRITKNFFAAATNLALAARAPLGQVDFFWADERCVPPDHPDSNFLLARENFLAPLGIAEGKIHRLKGELPPPAAAAEANAAIAKIAAKDASGLPVLDLIILGLGEDGHVASLMPNIPPAALDCREPYLHIDNSPKPPPNRLTLSYAAIAAARAVWMLASGAGKEVAFCQSLRPKPETPFGRVLQSRPLTTIYSDIRI
jgi:6-phosphogluconolactonase